MEIEGERDRPIAVFMAFGTKGDVYPIAAIAAAFAFDQTKYQVFFVTHSAHQDLAANLVERNVTYIPVSSPPVLSPPQCDDNDDSLSHSFSVQKRMVAKNHRKECLCIMERIFGDSATIKGDFVLVNFFALEGWSLAELFRVRCVIAAPYAVHYTAPSLFERKFKRELPLLYQYLQEAPADKLGWKDVMHWMWPLFSEEWASWRKDELNLSPWPFTDPVTELPTWHDRSCQDNFDCGGELCPVHTGLRCFLDAHLSMPLVFVGLSSAGSMGFLQNPKAFLGILRASLEINSVRFILFTGGYKPLHTEVQVLAAELDSSFSEQKIHDGGIALFNGRLFCFGGSMPYSWLFKKCAAAIHHGGSGSSAAALQAGIPQVLCPCMLDQFYWAERMFWLGVAPEPLKRAQLLPENCNELSITEGASMLSKAINYALSPEVKARAVEISKRIAQEDGVSEAIRILKEEVT
ncbi:hypothetical protein Cgig2_006717 [Carnegiea gigantea]|uniref:Erythromycin biosynthesis protein CIII-like C-terminal domain-containing protein n=1 Tax=Carnegiea gigantea TaxID=171969 RepID=A0A9Q1JSI7_9CARY|nr:hypothetical protein Cgig2_006717 [Carnegiea gigantea]